MTCSGRPDDDVTPVPNSNLEWATMEELQDELMKRTAGAVIIYQVKERTGSGYRIKHSYDGGLALAIGMAQLFISAGPQHLEDAQKNGNNQDR